jgi:hypothetical protein
MCAAAESCRVMLHHLIMARSVVGVTERLNFPGGAQLKRNDFAVVSGADSGDVSRNALLFYVAITMS